jgi:protein tyrosine phosphatase (PTP) superfamily phosphohydrolase (DUF442 family)
MKDLENILNYVQLSDNIATSGQPKANQFKLIANYGYASIINLAMEEAHNAIPNESKLLESLGISYIHIPVPFACPTTTHFQEFVKILKSLEGQKVWIHCAMNYRVSAFMYLYLKQAKGLPDSEAKSPMFERWKPDKIWSKFMLVNHTIPD